MQRADLQSLCLGGRGFTDEFVWSETSERLQPLASPSTCADEKSHGVANGDEGTSASKRDSRRQGKGIVRITSGLLSTPPRCARASFLFLAR
jgi:hypothetical protein